MTTQNVTIPALSGGSFSALATIYRYAGVSHGFSRTGSFSALATIYRYAGVSHGFSRTGSSAYRQAAAELARDRTLAFLKQHLGSAVIQGVTP